MTQYASKTQVTSDKSRAEIERTLMRYGADQFMYGWEANGALIAFRMKERHIRFYLPMPDISEYAATPTGKARRESARQEMLAQAMRQRWRALALVIKAKLEAVESGITEFEDEFLAHIQLPDGQTVGQWMKPQVALAYGSGDMPPLLPAPGNA